MSHKSAAINAIKGIDTGKLPYAPRFDLWFNAHRYRGTLPAEYRDCESALDIARKINVGGHIVIADFIRPGHPDQMLDRGIGLYNLPRFPYRVKLRRVERIVESDDISTTVTYNTPKGKWIKGLGSMGEQPFAYIKRLRYKVYAHDHRRYFSISHDYSSPCR